LATAYIAEFARTLDELAFSPGAFFLVYGLIGQPSLDFSVGHFCRFACTSVFARRSEATRETPLSEASNRNSQRWTSALVAAPLIYLFQK